MDHIVSEYGNWMRSWGAAERTISARQTIARNRLSAWGLEGFTQRNAETYLSNPDWSRWTRATYHGHLTSLATWLTATSRIAGNPMLDVRAVKKPKSRPRPLTEGDVARVLLTAKGEVGDWIRLALLSGLRAHEIAKIRGEDVQSDGIYILGKGGSVDILPCHPELWEMAQRYPRSGFWFPGIEDGHMRRLKVSLTVGRLFKSLGIDGSIHRCRHTFGTRLMRSGVNIRTVQKLMRHSNLETTANYTAVDEDELRAAIGLLHTA